jgi:hypothetical protein
MIQKGVLSLGLRGYIVLSHGAALRGKTIKSECFESKFFRKIGLFGPK